MENGQKMRFKNMILGRFLPPLQLLITQTFVKVGGWFFRLDNLLAPRNGALDTAPNVPLSFHPSLPPSLPPSGSPNSKLLNSAKAQAQPKIILDRLKAIWPIQLNEEEPKHHDDDQDPRILKEIKDVLQV